MKDPFLSRRKRPNQPKKLKFVCSFNGAFQPRPPSGNLRYTGGETRIVSVERNIGFSRLKSKISELLLLCYNNGPSFSLKYQLSAVGDDGAPLVLIASDGDVRCMIDDCEKLESHGKRTRLWIFVCNDNDYIYKHRTLNSDVSVNCVDTGNLYDDGFKSRNSTTSLCGSDYFSRKVKSSAMGVNGVQCSDDSLRKIVLKQLLLAKQSAQIRSFRGGSGLSFERSETEITSENQKYDQTVEGLISEPQGPGSHETPDLKFCGNQFRANVLDHEFRKPQLQRRGNLGMSPLPLSNSHPLNPRDGNPFMKTKGSMQCLTNRNSSISGNGAATAPGGSSQLVAAVQFREQSCDVNAMPIGTCGKNAVKSVQHSSLSKLDRDNNTPWSAICDLVNSRLVGGFYPTKSSSSDRVGYGLHSGIHHHWFAATNTRNQRTCSYHIRNHRNSNTDMGIHRNVKFEGRPWVGKFYPGLRSSSNISKHGQAMRLYCPCCWKAWPANQDHTPEGIGKLMDCGLMNQNQSPYGIKEKFKDKGGRGVSQPPRPNADEGHFAYNGASASMGDQFFLQTNHTLTSTKGMEALEHLSTSSTGQNDEVPCQAFCKTFDIVPMCKPSSWDIKESHFIKPTESISVASSPNNLGLRNGRELGCSGKLSNTESDIKSFSNHHNISQAIQGGLASSVNLSLDNLSLSSSKEADSPTHYSPTSNDISKPLLKSQSKPVDLMDSSGPQVGTSNGVASDSSSQNEAKLEKVDERKEEMQQQDYQSNLCIDEKADIKECQKCVKPIGTIPSDLAAFYAHLASRELQTIKSSDLEYIKELGSGTYGTVFYGKWKGCDVAIKKLKPSCFNEGAPEQDRLVADFWKEAHILGQLHHPHIVAFYGIVTDGPVTNLATVTEYMINGSLKQVLQRKDRTIDRRKRLIIAMDAAFGMEYLHEKNIVHFDLKSHNLLVNMRDPQRPVCKIGDLGLSKIKQRTLVSGGVRGTIPWMAPELLNITKNMVTEKVDVYSFGIVMWELLTGEEPYGKMRSEEIIAGIIKGNLRPEIPSWCDPAWRSLMERCWSSDPDSRPSFSEIAKELRAVSVAMNIK